MRESPLILIVDDEDIIRDIMAKLIHALGYTVLQASNSTEAVSLSRQHQPDLILLDIVMPGVDSRQVMHTVRADDSLKHTPIILMSGIDNLETITSYIEAGADDFLPKPFNKALLQLKISNALQRIASQQQLQQAQQGLDEFCHSLSHDLNNALTGIMMTSELLLMELDVGADKSRQRLEDIITSTEQASALIKQRRKTISNS